MKTYRVVMEEDEYNFLKDFIESKRYRADWLEWAKNELAQQSNDISKIEKILTLCRDNGLDEIQDFIVLKSDCGNVTDSIVIVDKELGFVYRKN